MHIAAIAVAMMLTACRLDARVSDQPGASAHLRPKGTVIPDVSANSELAKQISANDGIDDPLNAGVALETGGGGVLYWSFGAATAAPAPLYELFDDNGSRLDHPALVSALPGDPGYNPLHSIHRVVVTDEYEEELITTAEALADARELGKVEEPVPTGVFVNIPIVLAGTRIQTALGAPPPTSTAKEILYARGYTVAAFRFDGDFGVQPLLFGVLPTKQVSFIRGANEGSYNTAHPIFQVTSPSPPIGPRAGYSALSTVVRVDLASGTSASITSDIQLFTRSVTGEIIGTDARVQAFEVTTTNLVLQLQFSDNNP